MQRFNAVTQAFSSVGGRFGFQEVATPLFEDTPVFAKSLGEATDVVGKEMYTFDDRGGDSLTLRPEYTAGIARAYLSNGWQQHIPLKLMAYGAMFRYERPQKGRFRQFHQIDAEILGTPEPQADVELISFAAMLLYELGLGDKVVLNLNTLGDSESRAAYRASLVAYFSSHKASLSRESVERLEKNPLRILDSKDFGDQAVVADAPIIDSSLTQAAGVFFERLTKALDALKIKYIRNARLVRGLDYYSHTAFEFITTHLGAQGTVIGGGRYDGLIEQMGGPHTPSVGWAGGIERLAMLIDEPAPVSGSIVMVPVGEAAELAAIGIAQRLRKAGFRVEQGFSGNMKKRMAKASAMNAKVALILGESELEQHMIAVKDLATAEQMHVKLTDLETVLSTLVKAYPSPSSVEAKLLHTPDCPE